METRVDQANDPKVIMMTDTPADPAPPRPRRRRKEARPAEIIEAGFAEFAEKGFAAARLDDVARRAGVAKGTIYRYFENKEALFLAAVRSRVASALSDVAGLLETSPLPTRDLLRAMVSALYGRMVEGDLRLLMRVVIAESGTFPELAEAYHGETVARGRVLLGRLVQRGIARGEIRPGALTSLPEVLMAPAIMAVIWKLTFDRFDPIATDRFLAAHLDLIGRVILAPEP
jgi:AcrR family transcriptional regulator